LYVAGDQVHYHEYYDAVGGVNVFEAVLLGRGYLNAGEPFSLSVLWLGASLGVPKNVYISLLNSILVLSIFRLCRNYRCPWYSFVMLVSGYYVIVLMTGAERLKIAYLFMLLSLLFNGHSRYFLYFLSLFSHFQMLAFFVVTVLKSSVSEFLHIISSGRLRKKVALFLVVGTSVVVPMLFLLHERLFLKVIGYYGDGLKIFDFFNIFGLFCFSFLVYKRFDFRVWGVLLFIPFAIILGGSRVNIMAFSFAFYYFICYRKMNHPLVLFVLFYFLIKSYFFLLSIHLYGHGFG
jgi:hypothetical protein